MLFSRGALLSQTRSYFYNLNELEWLHLANNKSAGIPSGVETRLMGFPAFTGGTPARPAPASFVEAAARPVYALLNLLAIDGLNPFFGDVGVVPPLPSHAPRPAAARLATRHIALCGELWVHDDGGTRTTSWSRHFNRCERHGHRAAPHPVQHASPRSCPTGTVVAPPSDISKPAPRCGEAGFSTLASPPRVPPRARRTMLPPLPPCFARFIPDSQFLPKYWVYWSVRGAQRAC